MSDMYLGFKREFFERKKKVIKEKINEKCLFVSCASHIEKQGCHCKKTDRLEKSNLGAMKKADIESRCTLWLFA